jgi:hypothetical protein
LIPEAKTQSKNHSDFSRSAQKVDERGISKKVVEEDMGEEEKETPCHSEINGRVREAEVWCLRKYC